jgi:type IV secretion system protein VirB6
MLGSGLLWLCSMVLLLGTLGLIVAAKIVLAFLLAVGPIFIGMLLFDATRGLFEGWFRMTLSFALAPLAVNVFGAVMLMILQPFLAILMGNAEKRLFDMGPVMTVMLVVAVFAIVMLFGLRAVSGIASGFGTGRRRDDPPPMQRLPAPELPNASGVTDRAEQIAARIAMIDRSRDYATPAMAAAGASAGESWSRRTGEVADAVSHGPLLVADRLGQAYNRQPRPVSRPGDES